MTEHRTPPLSIVIGPRKTGTSWLHAVARHAAEDKEICFPRRIGKRYVYRRFVADATLLIWPYLAHEPDRLESLLEQLAANDRDWTLYACNRSRATWLTSMTRFRAKLGESPSYAARFAESEHARVTGNLESIAARHGLVRIDALSPGSEDLSTLSRLTGRSEEELTAALGTVVYATNEDSRLPALWLTDTFFRLKPFMPRCLRTITKFAPLRRLFFARAS